MANLSKIKREEMLATLQHLKQQYKSDDKTLAALNEIQTKLTQKKYGLIWEEHSEAVEDEMKTKIPVFSSDDKRKIKVNSVLGSNFLLEGDNLHSLILLEKTHKGKIDMIYIDPPYNTGNKDFKFNDSYIEKEDYFAHSKWLSFLYKRLKIARNLLTKNGVIFISIDDNECANLKLLCNEIFGEENFITQFVWEKTQHFGRQKVNYYSNCEYILCYAKRLYGNSKLKELLVEKIKTEFTDAPLYNASNRQNELIFPKNKVKFNLPDGTYKKTDNESYILMSPVKVKNGLNINDLKLKFKSRWSQEFINDELKKGTTFWVKSLGFAIRAIYGGDKSNNESPKQLIFTNVNNPFCATSRFNLKVGVTEEGSNELSKIVHNDLFSYPKPVSLIKYLISLFFEEKSNSFKKDFIVLDFFAGSGTTGQAVMELNKEDGNKRKFILCTNNEISADATLKYLHDNNQFLDYKYEAGKTKQSKIDEFFKQNPKVYQKLIIENYDKYLKYGICQAVTYPRLKTVITGKREDGSKYSDGIESNLIYYKTDFVEKNSEDLTFQLNKHIKEMIQLELGEIISNEEFPIILTDEDADEIEKKIMKSNKTKCIYVSNDVCLTSSQKKLFDKIGIKTIPDNYFDFELREQGEIF